MTILGIETSCDETAAAVVVDGQQLRSSVVASQIATHAQYGGVVPEIAARSHIEAIVPVIKQALGDAKLDWADIDGIAVANGPGLNGSLLIGTLAARTLATLRNKPLYGVNHVEAHMYAAWIDAASPKFPVLALIVSGGHTQLVLLRDHGDYQLLGQTLDDAAGEAFDKVAKICGLPYPGGPSIDKAAKLGDSRAFALPKAKTANPLDFSFSGVKTAVLRAAQLAVGDDHKLPSYELPERLTEQQKNDLAASFQRVAVETLVDKLETAAQAHSPASIIICGGVAANQTLRAEASRRLGEVIYPPFALCTDNAAMIAARAGFGLEPIEPAKLHVSPTLSM